jgi:hypothetical protein
MPARPLPVIPGAFRIRTLGSNSAVGTQSQNRLVFQANPLSTMPTALALATAFGAYWNAFVAGVLTTDYHLDQIGCIDLSTSSSTEVFATHAIVGGIAGVSAAPNLCAEVKHSTGVRHKVGKTYLSPLQEGDLQPGSTFLTTAFTTVVNNAWADLITHFTADTVWGAFPPLYCVLSQVTAGVTDGRTITVLSSSAEQKLASQRRRRGY